MKATTLFKLPSLLGHEVSPCVPWEEKHPSWKTPKNKQEADAAASDPHYDGCYISAYEGLTPGLRVTATNKPFKMHGIIADFDCLVRPEDMEETFKNMRDENRPTAYHNTMSGGVRAIWMFETPIPIYGEAHDTVVSHLLDVLHIKKLFPRLDPCVKQANQYYIWSPHNLTVTKNLLASERLNAIVFDALDRKKNFKGNGDVEIPLEEVKKRVEELYPGGWTGSFEPKSRGNPFWNPSRNSPRAAMVTPTGMVAFGEEKGFFTWGELLGRDWVEGFEQARFGKPSAEWFFNTDRYWKKDNYGAWRSYAKEDARLEIQHRYRLSKRPRNPDDLSEVDRALVHIREVNTVEGVIPLPFHPEDVVYLEDIGKVINTSKVRPMEHAEKAGEWGEHFPFLAKFFTGFFEDEDSVDPLPYFLAWIKRFYVGGLHKKPNQGQAIFLAGGVGTGKTLLGQVILGYIIGGFSDASAYLCGSTSWNGHLLRVPLWSVDDTMAAVSYDKHAAFSNMIKRGVANVTHVYEEKYAPTVKMTWKGRIVVTMNDDAESINAIPLPDGSILDKIMLFKVAHRRFPFPKGDVLEYTIKQELPHLLAWLMKWETPEEVISKDERFGVRSYHHPTLLAGAKVQTRGNMMSELIDLWVETKREKEESVWDGTATDLFLDMSVNDRLTSVIRSYIPSADALGRRMSILLNIREDIKRAITKGRAKYFITIPALDKPKEGVKLKL